MPNCCLGMRVSGGRGGASFSCLDLEEEARFSKAQTAAGSVRTLVGELDKQGLVANRAPESSASVSFAGHPKPRARVPSVLLRELVI